MELKHQSAFNAFVAANLLIVPYGIETALGSGGLRPALTFNRTLWN